MVISLNSIAQLYEQKEMGYYSQKINDSYSERFNAEPAFVKERSSALSCFQKSLDLFILWRNLAIVLKRLRVKNYTISLDWY